MSQDPAAEPWRDTRKLGVDTDPDAFGNQIACSPIWDPPHVLPLSRERPNEQLGPDRAAGLVLPLTCRS
jgi:hypothetical protein